MNGREIIDVGTDQSIVSQLALQANGGATFVRGVQLILGKGDVQWVPVNAWLVGRRSISFDVDHRRGRVIQQVIVFGNSDPGARYSITAQR